MKKRLCLIYNFAPHYREAIFRLINAEYACDWFLAPVTRISRVWTYPY